jgi:hypothetical protein
MLLIADNVAVRSFAASGDLRRLTTYDTPIYHVQYEG